MIHECLLILTVVRNVGDSKDEPLQSLVLKEANILHLMIEVGNVAVVQWPRLHPPVLRWRNSDTETVLSVEFIIGWSRSSDII